MTACPHCKKELDQPASIDVREPVKPVLPKIRGKKYMVVHRKQIGGNFVDPDAETLLYCRPFPVVLLQRVKDE